MEQKKCEEMKQNLARHLAQIDAVIANGPYQDTWESLAMHKVPDWYRNAKFGIFIHWGVFSVPSFGDEWYPRWMYLPESKVYGHHLETYGSPKDFGYKDFVPMFKAEKFDPAQWAELFKEAGARYVMPVAEHHDGFQLYDSDLSDWCATKKGPHMDVIGLLKQEIEKRDMVMTASSHRIEHYWFMNGMRSIESDMPEDLSYGDLYWPALPDPILEGDGESISGFRMDELFMQDWLARCCELIDKYRPKILYFDWWIHVEPMKPYLRKFAAYYYNRAAEWGEEVTINYKNDAFSYGTAVRDIERGQLGEISPLFWQTDTSVAKNSWGYTEGNDYKQANEIICDLVDIVSKNGTMLLNIGPKPDGTIPEEDASILRTIGKWLKVNGEGIYDSYFWKKFGEGPTVVKEGSFTDIMRSSFTSEDFRFTYKPGVIYAFAMRWPEDGVVRIRSLGRRSQVCNAVIRNVAVLGAPNSCQYKQCGDYLTVMADGISTDAPVCIKISVD